MFVSALLKGNSRSLAIPFLMLMIFGCECGPVLTPILPPEDQIDVYSQKNAAAVDILWVVDNSDSMAAEQQKIAARFADFFAQFLISQVDYQIGVITTDPGDNAILRPYDGPDVPGCDRCRFLTSDVGCENPAVETEGLDPDAIDDILFDQCQAQLVFRKLVTAGIGGSSFEEGFSQAALAVGGGIINENGFPTRDIPAENDGFLRTDASLFVVFVSDEDEGAKKDGSPIRYYQRLFESVKGAGNENLVSASAIVGWPFDAPVGIEEVCPILATTFDGSPTPDPRAAQIQEILNDSESGCFDEAGDGEGADRAETGSRYIELACRTGGVVVNMCEDDYSVALDKLGANAAGLTRKFDLSKPELFYDGGPDCIHFTEDDNTDDMIDCDIPPDGTLDSLICVRALAIGEEDPAEGEPLPLVPRDPVNGWEFEATTKSIRFNGNFVPKPGSEVLIQYKIQEAESTRCLN